MVTLPESDSVFRDRTRREGGDNALRAFLEYQPSSAQETANSDWKVTTMHRAFGGRGSLRVTP